MTHFSATSEDGICEVPATRALRRVLEEIDLDQRTVKHGQELPWCATLIIDVITGRLLVAHHKPQAHRAAAAVEWYAESDPAVVLGDLDVPPDPASVSFWRGRRSLDGVSVCYQDAWETIRPNDTGFAFSAENSLVQAAEVATAVSGRIDYVLVRLGSTVPGCVVTCDRVLGQPVDGVWPSTTSASSADLTVPEYTLGTRETAPQRMR